ncbi:MAG: lytic transglycosylase domain-containing protein [Alphaproteobacteria bacterium]|nr:lytic transglycosylase domain-containing protein [Alphaproteobacteria bacterium]
MPARTGRPSLRFAAILGVAFGAACLAPAPMPSAEGWRPLGPAAARAQGAAAAEHPALRAALGHVAAGRWQEAQDAIAAHPDPVADKLIRFLRLTASSGYAGADEIAAFMADNPGWPLRATLQQRLEGALAASTDDSAVLLHFRAFPPRGAAGLRRHGAALAAAGENAAATETLRAAWPLMPADAGIEQDFLARYGAVLRPEDHALRFHRLANAGNAAAASRALTYLPAREQGLGQLRLAFLTNAEIGTEVEAAARRMPHAGLALDQARWLFRRGREGEAAEILGALDPRLFEAADAPSPEQVWPERQRIARRLLRLAAGDLAYQAVRGHGLAGGEAFVDAEFLAGWIALRFRNDPAAAARHFEHLFATVRSTIGKGRGAFWAGQAALARGDARAADRWFAEATTHPTAFYGQIAALEAPEHAERLRRSLREASTARADNAAERAFEQNELVRAVRMLAANGHERRARPFLRHLLGEAKTQGEQMMVTRLAASFGAPAIGLDVARRAAQLGAPVGTYGFPVPINPPQTGPEPALLLALMRQESNFDRYAVSHAGARGLMQLMPGTARQVSRGLGMRYDLGRLTRDPDYNMALGTSYLSGLLGQFGSVPMALAGYNAGPHRVRQWLEDYGDPRSGAIDLLDWMELIPFSETRNYVQRVLEGYTVYRVRLGQDDPLAGHPLREARELAQARQAGNRAR